MEIIKNSYNSADLFYKNQNNKKYYLKKPLEPLSSSIFLLSCTTHFDILENGYNDFKKNFTKKIPYYSVIGIISILLGMLEKEIPIKEKEDITMNGQIKQHLLLSQIGLSILSGIEIIRGIKRIKQDRRGGIIATCLSGVALAATTISNIATWKNYKKDNQK